MGAYLFTSVVAIGSVFVISNYNFYKFLTNVELYECYQDSSCKNYLNSFSKQMKNANDNN